MRPLVLPTHAATEVHTPGLVGTGRVAQRLEGNGHFDRPPAVEAPRPQLPHLVPVAVWIPFVGEGLIGEGAQWIGVEDERVPAIVKRVEEHAEAVVLAQLVAVASQIVGRPLRRRRRVPATRRDVHRRAIEEDPHLGLVGGRLAFVRHRLDEIADGGDRLVDRLVQATVDAHVLGRPDRAHDDVPRVIARNDRRGDWRSESAGCRTTLAGGGGSGRQAERETHG